MGPTWPKAAAGSPLKESWEGQAAWKLGGRRRKRLPRCWGGGGIRVLGGSSGPGGGREPQSRVETPRQRASALRYNRPGSEQSCRCLSKSRPQSRLGRKGPAGAARSSGSRPASLGARLSPGQRRRGRAAGEKASGGRSKGSAGAAGRPEGWRRRGRVRVEPVAKPMDVAALPSALPGPRGAPVGGRGCPPAGQAAGPGQAEEGRRRGRAFDFARVPGSSGGGAAGVAEARDGRTACAAASAAHGGGGGGAEAGARGRVGEGRQPPRITRTAAAASSPAASSAPERRSRRRTHRGAV